MAGLRIDSTDRLAQQSSKHGKTRSRAYREHPGVSVGLPDVFHSAVSGVHETADARPFRWLLEDSQPDVGSASNAFEGKMASEIIIRRMTLRLPECRWWQIECGTNFGDIDVKSGRNMLAVRSASEDF